MVALGAFAAAEVADPPTERDGVRGAAAFQHWFLSKAVPKLAKATRPGDLSLGNAPAYNAFEGISQPFADDPASVLYARVASTNLRAAIAETRDPRQVYFRVAFADTRDACDLFAPVHEATQGVDGRVSIEVDPRSAHLTEKTQAIIGNIHHKNIFHKRKGDIDVFSLSVLIYIMHGLL